MFGTHICELTSSTRVGLASLGGAVCYLSFLHNACGLKKLYKLDVMWAEKLYGLNVMWDGLCIAGPRLICEKWLG